MHREKFVFFFTLRFGGKEVWGAMYLVLAAMMPTMAWDVFSFLQNASETMKKWVGAFVILLGIILIGFGVWKIFWSLANHGKGPSNYGVAIVMIILGGALAVGGWAFVFDIAQGGRDTIYDLGGQNPILSMLLHRTLL